MSVDRGDDELRRYLLGELSDEECATLEQDYFARQDALDRMSAAENDLIDEYVADELAVRERERFESHYLIVPAHRARVAVARQLRAATRSPRPAASMNPGEPSGRKALGSNTLLPMIWKTAVAAGVLLAAGSAVWLDISSPHPGVILTSGDRTELRDGPDSTQATGRNPRASSPGVIAISLSPATVRGADESSPLMIAAGVERIQIVLEGAGGGVTHAVIRKVAGGQVWRGAAADGAAPGELARLDVPASVLPPDDYVIELSGLDTAGRESERSRYVLRVRAP
jgi:hypothetical protein